MSSCRFYIFLFVSNGKKGKVYTNYIHEYWTRNYSNTSYRRLKIKYKTSPRSLMKNQLPTPPSEVQLVQTMPPQRKGHTRPCSLLGARWTQASPPRNPCWEQNGSISTRIRSSVIKPTTHLATVNSSAGTVRMEEPAGHSCKDSPCWTAGSSEGTSWEKLVLSLPHTTYRGKGFQRTVNLAPLSIMEFKAKMLIKQLILVWPHQNHKKHISPTDTTLKSLQV